MGTGISLVLSSLAWSKSVWTRRVLLLLLYVLLLASVRLRLPPTPPLPPPGFLMSLDDFYLLGSGLLMTQTSIGVFNASLFSGLNPHSLLAWQRVRLANSLAKGGEEWAEVFSKHNSGERL